MLLKVKNAKPTIQTFEISIYHPLRVSIISLVLNQEIFCMNTDIAHKQIWRLTSFRENAVVIDLHVYGGQRPFWQNIIIVSPLEKIET